VVNLPNVLLYYKTPDGLTYFGNNLAFTFSNSLIMATGSYVAVYADSFTTPFTITATDSTNQYLNDTTISAASTSMTAVNLLAIITMTVTMTPSSGGPTTAS
jgi:hypothetical protein